MILNKGVGHENIGANLTAPCNFFLNALDILDFFKVLALFDFNKLGTEHIHTNLAVLVLGTLNLRADNNAGGNMGKTNGGGGLVNLLTACAGGAVNVHFNVFLTDFNGFVVLNFRHYFKRSKRGVTAPRSVERRDTNKAVDAVFRFKKAVGVFTLYNNCCGFKSGVFAVKPVNKGVFVIVAGCPGSVHAVKHLAPILRLGAAGSGMKSKNGVAVIIFAGKQGGKFNAVNIFGKLINFGKGFFVKVAVILFGSHFNKRHGVVIAVFKIFMRSNFIIKLAHFLLNFGRGFNIIPKVGVSLLCFKASYLRTALFKTEGVCKVVYLRLHSKKAQAQFF